MEAFRTLAAMQGLTVSSWFKKLAAEGFVRNTADTESRGVTVSEQL
jgi:hypothetical protein